ncbi:hypothetical protein LINGRAHAP2_LOCUS30525 [Linum grandiflorum]
MTSESSDGAAIRFNGQNFPIWEYSFRVFVLGKGLLAYLDGTKKLPVTTAINSTEVETWNTNNAKVLSWLISSVDLEIALTFRSFTTATEVWAHLKEVYSRMSTSKLFDLEYELSNLVQGELDVNQYYMATSRIWTELDLLASSKLSATVEAAVLKERQKTRILQFLMKLRPKFEVVRAQLLSKDDLTMTHVLGELSRVEVRLRTQLHLDSSNNPMNSAFAVKNPRPQFTSVNNSPVLAQQGVATPSGQRGAGGSHSKFIDFSTVKCTYCGLLGHSIFHCKKRNICTYCKKPGHIIPDYSVRRPRSSGRNKASYAVTPSVLSTDTENSIDRLVQAALGRHIPSALNAAFATVGLIGKSTSWLLDSATFNHMSGDRSAFQYYVPVQSSVVEVANGAKLPVAGVGTVIIPNMTLPHTLHILDLIPNLVSVGQLTDDGCVVSFGPGGCTVQDGNQAGADV